jgi:hypothetical protein
VWESKKQDPRSIPILSSTDGDAEAMEHPLSTLSSFSLDSFLLLHPLSPILVSHVSIQCAKSTLNCVDWPPLLVMKEGDPHLDLVVYPETRVRLLLSIAAHSCSPAIQHPLCAWVTLYSVGVLPFHCIGLDLIDPSRSLGLAQDTAALYTWVLQCSSRHPSLDTPLHRCSGS